MQTTITLYLIPYLLFLIMTTTIEKTIKSQRMMFQSKSFLNSFGLNFFFPQVIIKRQDPFKNGRCRANTSKRDDNLYTKMYNTSYSSTVRLIMRTTLWNISCIIVNDLCALLFFYFIQRLAKSHVLPGTNLKIVAAWSTNFLLVTSPSVI